MCRQRYFEVDLRFSPKSLFQHFGTESSLKGKVQSLKATGFIETSQHNNPPAILSTSLKIFEGKTLENVYMGLSIFWGFKHDVNNTDVTFINFKFIKPIRIRK